MTRIEKNIRAECTIEPDGHGSLWFKVAGKQHSNTTNRKSLKLSREIHVKYRLRDVRNAAKLLRRYGFKVIPPSKA